MKKYSIVAIVTSILITFSGCADMSTDTDIDTSSFEQEKAMLEQDIAQLQEEKSALQAEVIEIKEEIGTAKYIVTFEIKQTHFNLNIKDHLKDSVNSLTIEIPVDKDFYESLNEGDIIDDEFRLGSFVTHGSLGSWKVKVKDKQIL